MVGIMLITQEPLKSVMERSQFSIDGTLELTPKPWPK
jgi:hypothetical protein